MLALQNENQSTLLPSGENAVESTAAKVITEEQLRKGRGEDWQESIALMAARWL